MKTPATRTVLPLAFVGLVLSAGLVAGLTDTTAERWLKRELGLPHTCIPETSESAGWRAEDPLPAPIDEPRAVTIAGRIYVAGGIAEILFPEEESDDPGAPARVPVRSVRDFTRYDPRSGRFEPLAPMPEALNHIGLVKHGDDIYAVGGHGERLYGGDARAALFRYSLAQDRWTRLPDMPTPRGALAVGVIGDRLYAAGGMTSGRPLGRPVAALEVFDFERRRWSRGPDMPAPREHVAGAVAGGRLYVLGGRNVSTDSLPAATRFSPATGRWEELPPLRVPSGGLEGLAVDDDVVVMGGGDDRRGTVTGAVQRFDTASGRWSALPDMRTPRHGFAAALVGDRIYTMGGSPCAMFAASDTIESYDTRVAP
jgi:Kelch motif